MNLRRFDLLITTGCKTLPSSGAFRSLHKMAFAVKKITEYLAHIFFGSLL